MGRWLTLGAWRWEPCGTTREGRSALRSTARDDARMGERRRRARRRRAVAASSTSRASSRTDRRPRFGWCRASPASAQSDTRSGSCRGAHRRNRADARDAQRTWCPNYRGFPRRSVRYPLVLAAERPSRAFGAGRGLIRRAPGDTSRVSSDDMPRTYRVSRKKAVGLLVLASVFVAISVVMIADGIAFGWLAIAFFGLGVPLSIWQLVAPGSLTIDETTIEVRHYWWVRRYQLAECGEFRPWDAGHELVVFDYHGEPRPRSSAVGQARAWLHRFIARHLRARGPGVVGTPERGSRPRSRRELIAPSCRSVPHCRFGQSARVTKQSAEEQLAEIQRLLDEGVGRQNLEDLTLVQRVQDVIASFNSWSDLAIKRLHEIHRLQGEECEFCANWLDR